MFYQDEPVLRFPEFNDEWETIKLSNFLEFIPTNSLSRAKLNLDEGVIKNIHYGDIHTKFPTIVDVNIEEIPYINLDEDTSKFKKEQFCKEGDLIIADASEDYADIGKAIELVNVNTKLVAGLHTILARDKLNKTVSGFKGYLFLNENLRKQIKIRANGISVLGISKNNIAKLDVNLPSLQEQEKIVSFLRAVDKKIELLEKKLFLYQELDLSFKNQIFNSFKTSSFIKLKDLCQIKKGKQLNKSDMINNGEYYVLNGGKERSGYTNSWNVEENTITISEGGNSCGFVSYNTEKFFCGGHCYYLIIKENNIDSYYLFHYLKYIEPKIMKLRVGSGLPNIQKGDVENINILELEYEKQKKIGNFFEVINTKIVLNLNEKEKLEKYKKSLLQKMFV